jgi:transposase
VQPAHQPAGTLLSRRHRAVQRAAFADRARLPAPLSHQPRRGRTHPGQAGRVPAPPALLRPQARHRAAGPVADRPSSRDQPGRGSRPGGLRVALLDAIQACARQDRELEAEIIERLEVHADATVFTSLPKAGHRIRAADLLGELGDVRARFPNEECLAALGGAAPVTITSGKRRVVKFRWACDKKLRNALIDFADDSRHASPWAAKVYADALARTGRHPHAVRILARAWIRVMTDLAGRSGLRTRQAPRSGDAPGRMTPSPTPKGLT